MSTSESERHEPADSGDTGESLSTLRVLDLVRPTRLAPLWTLCPGFVFELTHRVLGLVTHNKTVFTSGLVTGEGEKIMQIFT